MKYVGTRGQCAPVDFKDALMSTYAADGGLYVPTSIPNVTSTLMQWKGFSVGRVCAHIVSLYCDIPLRDLESMAESAFLQFNNGRDPSLPLTEVVKHMYLLDASLGPTLAFKDIGQQFVGQLLSYYLEKQQRRATILVETSGDTGPAAIAAVINCPRISIYCLYPYNRVSDIQELQMTTVSASNVHVYRTEGDSDDQAAVLKDLFADKTLPNICSINSINWARVMVQSTYYVWAYLSIFADEIATSSDDPELWPQIIFSVPTGAFGNAMGGLLAKLMGIPIKHIICATNSNDIVTRTIVSGDFSLRRSVATISPAMDIQCAYNLERMFYFLSGGDSDLVRTTMRCVETSASASTSASCAECERHIDSSLLRRIQEIFCATSISDDKTMETMRVMWRQHRIALCPHSAIGVHAAMNDFYELTHSGVVTVCVLTANPLKFDKTFADAVGEPLPFTSEYVERLRSLPQKYIWLRKTPGDDWKSQWIQQLRDAVLSEGSE